MDFYGFYTGKIFDAYEWLGAHLDRKGTVFRTFAPQASRVELVFPDKIVQMNQVFDGNFYEVLIPDIPCGTAYEYRIWSGNGKYIDHCDPYGYLMEFRPKHKSIVHNLKDYIFSDDEWMKKRTDMKDKPLNIYEIHAGSFRKPNPKTNDFYNYEELGNMLIPYLKQSGYNYVEFLPLCEHPCDESWGYQITGYFSPTSRYGSPQQLMKLIDMLHQNNIGAILDFVPVHFAVDEYALAKYDGTALYEYPHTDVGMSEWGSCNFIHSRGEVCSFLQSSANYWLKEFHFDGLRMDAVSRMIYWQGDEKRVVNSNALEFVKNMNRNLKKLNPGCILIAEDSTSFAKVTTDIDKGGLGFDYKWDLGWMHDTLSYFALPPYKRRENYHKITFSMLYFKDENYLLPFSHDEVVHGKGTILNKIYGSYDGKLKQAKALYMYMTVHPGKKLNFMGNEIAQLREWDEKREQDWNLCNNLKHRLFYEYICKLNEIYLSHPALYEYDYDEDGFEWADCHQESRSVYAIERKSENETLMTIFNFGDSILEDYSLDVKYADKAEVLLYSDWKCFGGNTNENKIICKLEDNKLIITLQGYSSILIKLIP